MTHYDKAGNPITVDEWLELYNDDGYRRIALDEGDNWSVSTVWTGLAFGSNMIFETLGNATNGEQLMWRWQTEEQARIGHTIALGAVLGEKWVLAPDGWCHVYSGIRGPLEDLLDEDH